MRKLLIIIGAAALLIFSFFYFEMPLILVRPVFHTDSIGRYASEYGVDPLLVTALIKVESNFLHRARSHRGAVGLMQLMPATADEAARELGLNGFRVIDLENPDVNIRLGTYYLAKLVREFDGDVVLSLAAYNAGFNKVHIWYVQDPLIGIEVDDIPYRETRNYVKNILSTYQWLKRIQTLKNSIRPKTA